MSLYEILAVVVLVGAGGFAYRLYRMDTRPGASPPPVSGESMYGRDRKSKD
jgi:hypothetical protein